MVKHVVVLLPHCTVAADHRDQYDFQGGGEMGCLAALQRCDGFADLLKLRTGGP